MTPYSLYLMPNKPNLMKKIYDMLENLTFEQFLVIVFTVIGFCLVSMYLLSRKMKNGK